MSRPPCPIDTHPDRPAIDSSIRAGLWSTRDLAEHYRVGAADIARHQRRCLTRAHTREPADGSGASWVPKEEPSP